MERVVDPDRKHHFFKILVEQEETRMRIPEAFCSRISAESQSCKWAVVQGPSGAQWVTEVNKNQDGIFLGKGWEVFVRENGLQIYDFLVFRYEGNMQFYVKVFNIYGVPREECFTSGRSSASEEKDRIRRGRPGTSSRSRERRFVEQQRRQREDGDKDEITKKSLELNSSRKKRSVHKKDAKEIERGFASRSGAPFFRITVQPSYLNNHLPIPHAARRLHFPDDVHKVKVKASDGRSWEIKVLRTKLDIRFTKGVSRFMGQKDGMNLKVGDVCIFEIVKKRSNQLVLQVHVFGRVPVLDDDLDE
ncbi:hypothetical protein MKW94_001188 [Papaver nudicaule]|uniref:TF-B3 domain-containing protein n=1 Tax=Papaver nudicaule TaxID=74823 RepID=A0AA41S320_PAPNU|nr:hypothetical protein [Papaver nudicaule]